MLIEAGGSDRRPCIRVPGLLESALSKRAINWAYRGDPDPTLGGRELTWAAGRVLGGSSSINGMVCGRGLPADYDRWVAAGNPGWDWNSMLPWFKRLEDWTGPPNPARGRGGPLTVRRFEDTDAACRSAMEALIDLGVPMVEDYCIGIIEGVGLTQATQRRGRRHSAADAYLRSAPDRPNLAVWRDTHALGLLLDRSRCVGVRVAGRGQVHELRAERETLVCAGAIGSPTLLLRSGIGAPDALEPHGIEVAHRLPAVGRHLNDHVNVLISAFVNRPTYNTQRRGLAALRHAARWLATGGGPASSPANHCQAFVRTDPGRPFADVQIQLMPLGFGSPADMHRDGITAVVSLCRPAARGRVQLRSANPAMPPRIDMPLLAHTEDVETLIRGCRLAREALERGPGRRFGGRIYAPAGPTPGGADWLDFLRQSAGLNWHPTSTCRMGPGPDDVVDAELRVHGMDGLRVVDASVMPSITSGNTHIPVVAIAERAAELILRDH